MTLNVVIFASSCRPHRLNDRVITLVKEAAEKRKFVCTVVDPRECQLPILDTPLNLYPNPSEAPDKLKKIYETLSAADAFIIVSTEYNRTIPPGLINLLDYFSTDVYAYKPAGIVTYSTSFFGGNCAGVHLQSALNELGTLVVPEMVAIACAEKRIDDNGHIISTVEDTDINAMTESSLNILLSQLSFVGAAIGAERKRRREMSGPDNDIPQVHYYC